MDRFLQRVEHATKAHATAREVIREVDPDVVVVSPMVHFFTPELEYVKAARAAGIPTVLAVASWDNLTNKGKMKVMPDVVAVWNDAMATEATRLHGVPKDRIVVTGAPVFDWWFDDTARWTREDFLQRAGLDAANCRPLILYLCSTTSIAGGSEVEVVLDWVRAVRSSGEDGTRNAQIVVRPHPMALDPWRTFLEERSARPAKLGFSIFPADLTHPTNDEQRTLFYNSIFHADAIVGLNTSAMIEAAILSRPVLTFKGHAAETSQTGNLHFRHLTESGCVRLAADLGEHIGQLDSVLNDPDQGVAEQAKTFVSRFVRPLGMETAASDRLADVVMATGKGLKKAL